MKKEKKQMAKEEKPNLPSYPVLATVHFTKPRKPIGYGIGFVVLFAVPPKVGEKLTVDQYSIRKIPQEELHQCYWKVVEVEHNLNLAEFPDEEFPLANLSVTVHPLR
jgi:hypothetical protein